MKGRNGASIILNSALIWSPEEVSGVPVVKILFKLSSLEEGVGERPSDPHRWTLVSCTLVRPEHEPDGVVPGQVEALGAAGVVVDGHGEAAVRVVGGAGRHPQEVCERHVVSVKGVSVSGGGGGGLEHGVLGVPE